MILPAFGLNFFCVPLEERQQNTLKEKLEIFNVKCDNYLQSSITSGEIIIAVNSYCDIVAV